MVGGVLSVTGLGWAQLRPEVTRRAEVAGPFEIRSLKAVFLVLTLLGHASLWLAIMADSEATLLVVPNALRLLRSNE